MNSKCLEKLKSISLFLIFCDSRDLLQMQDKIALVLHDLAMQIPKVKRYSHNLLLRGFINHPKYCI